MINILYIVTLCLLMGCGTNSITTGKRETCFISDYDYSAVWKVVEFNEINYKIRFITSHYGQLSYIPKKTLGDWMFTRNGRVIGCDAYMDILERCKKRSLIPGTCK